MIIKAQQKNLPITPRKMQLVVNAIKHMPPTEAVALLELYNKKSALHLAKTIKQALANATNNLKLPAQSLKFHQILMGRGLTMKRFHSGARGRGKPYEKVRTHLTVLLKSVELTSVKPVFSKVEARPALEAETKPKKVTRKVAPTSLKPEKKVTKVKKTK